MVDKKLIVRLWIGHCVAQCLLFPLFYYVVRYRRRVVQLNLQLAFPEKSLSERKRIERAFYRNFSDMILEVIVGRNFDKEQMQQVISVYNHEEMAASCKQYGGCFLMLGHFLNWEWMSAVAVPLAENGADFGVVYKRLENSFFDKLVHKLRNRRGGFLIEMNHLLRVVARRKDESSTPTIYAMLADQRPRKIAKCYWTTLMNQYIDVMTGTEQLAKKFRYPIYYASLSSSKRGHYSAVFKALYLPDVDGELAFGTITERFTRELEKNILQEPTRWLWSHNRFSHRKPK